MARNEIRWQGIKRTLDEDGNFVPLSIEEAQEAARADYEARLRRTNTGYEYTIPPETVILLDELRRTNTLLARMVELMEGQK